MSYEMIADGLEASGNYKVLRRLPPISELMLYEVPDGCKIATIVDTETTGLDTATAKITEIALLPVMYDADLNIRGIGASYTALQDPGEPLSEEVMRVTGLMDHMLKGHEISWPTVARMLVSSNVVIAQNAGFDRPIVERHLNSLIGPGDELTVAATSRPWACTKNELPWQQWGFGSSSQTAVAMHLGYFYEAHRAMGDVLALGGILARPLPTAQAFADAVRGRDVPTGYSIFHYLLESARRTWTRVYATGSPFEAKDKLKARGYRWDDKARVWSFDIKDTTHGSGELSPVDAEAIWLKENAGVTKPRTEELTARTRYK